MVMNIMDIIIIIILESVCYFFFGRGLFLFICGVYVFLQIAMNIIFYNRNIDNINLVFRNLVFRSRNVYEMCVCVCVYVFIQFVKWLNKIFFTSPSQYTHKHIISRVLILLCNNNNKTADTNILQWKNLRIWMFTMHACMHACIRCSSS